jgi:hypothetical protein
MAFKSHDDEEYDEQLPETELERAMAIDNGEFVSRMRSSQLEKRLAQIQAERAGLDVTVDECPVCLGLRLYIIAGRFLIIAFFQICMELLLEGSVTICCHIFCKGEGSANVDLWSVLFN